MLCLRRRTSRQSRPQSERTIPRTEWAQGFILPINVSRKEQMVCAVDFFPKPGMVACSAWDGRLCRVCVGLSPSRGDPSRCGRGHLSLLSPRPRGHACGVEAPRRAGGCARDSLGLETASLCARLSRGLQPMLPLGVELIPV